MSGRVKKIYRYFVSFAYTTDANSQAHIGNMCYDSLERIVSMAQLQKLEEEICVINGFYRVRIICFQHLSNEYM